MSHTFRTLALGRYLAATILLLAVVLSAAACGDGDEKATPAPSETPSPTPGSPTETPFEEDLAAMVLTRSDLGPELAELSLQETSGFDTNEARIQAADDPEEEARDQETFGRLGGFDREFFDPGALVAGEGVLVVRSGATLFADADGASGRLEDGVADVERHVGQPFLGLLLEAADRFEVSEVGEEAIGLRTRASMEPEAEGDESTRVYITYVWFQRGRLMGDIAIARMDDVDVSAQALDLAARLDERIQAVLQGELTPSP